MKPIDVKFKDVKPKPSPWRESFLDVQAIENLLGLALLALGVYGFTLIV